MITNNGSEYLDPRITNLKEEVTNALVTKAPEYLHKGLEIMGERGDTYKTEEEKSGSEELEERSFKKVADLFNVATGMELEGSHVALVQVFLKIVRNETAGFHKDSIQDGVNYMALYGEERELEHRFNSTRKGLG